MTRTETGRGRFARSIGMAAVVATTAATLLVTAAGPASAGGPWFVALTGNNANTCLSLAQACRNINAVFTKPAFTPGDTINVAAGTYLNERPSITQAVNIVGAGAGATIINGSATPAAQASTVSIGVVLPAPNQIVTISGVTITGGRGATFGGGGILISGGDLRVNDSVITGNFAHGLGGGGIASVGKSFGGNPIITLNGTTVSNNQTLNALPGAGIYTAGPLTLNSSTVTGNVVNGAGFGALGGGIYANRLIAADTTTVTTTSTNITSNGASFGGGVLVGSAASYSQNGGSISGNTAINGGGLYVIGVGNPNVPNTNATASLSGVAVDGNTANGGAVANGGNGGGILNAGSLTTNGVTMNGNRVIASSVASLATGWGGGLYTGPVGAGDKPTNNHTGLTINGGAVNPNALVGGGLAVTGNVFGVANVTLPTFTASNLTLNGNTALVGGGGGYFGVSATINGGSITANQGTSTNSTGGGLWLAKNPASSPNPTLAITAQDIVLNSAVSGGGLAVSSGGAATLNDTLLSQNTATFGGAIVNAGTVTAAGTVINDNDASFQGGGAWNASTVVTDFPTFTASGGTTFNDNTAASAGGGMVVGARGTFSQTGGSINGNTATAGGGLYVAEGGTATVTTASINGNLANGLLGGGVLNSGTTTITNTTLSGNEALISAANTGLGGAIYNGSNADGNTASLVVDRSTLSGNEAATASAIYSRSQGAGAVNKLSIRNSTISGNHTVGGWAALVSFHPMTISTSTIVGNTSPTPTFTSGLFISGGTVGLAGSIIAGHTGGNCNAPVANGGSNLTDPGDATCGLPLASRVDPQLHPLDTNGGTTLTHLPTSTSPAINAVAPSTATGLTDSVSAAPVVLCAPAAVDQRGTARPQGPTCDIGSVEADLSAPTVNGPANPVFVIGAPASYDYTSTGVPAPDLSTAGALPPGVTFTDNGDGTGTLAGTPEADTAGPWPITIVGSNGTGPNANHGVLIQVNQPASIEGPATGTMTVGLPSLGFQFTAIGEPTPTLSTASELPAGVSFTDNGNGNAVIDGTPQDGEGAVYVIDIEATNGVGDVAHFEFTLTVNEAPQIDGPASATYEVGEAGGPTTFTSDGYPDAELTVSGGPLPEGVTFTDNGDGTGSFSGTPADGEGGEYHLTVTASNGVAPDDSTDITLTVDEAPEITGPAEVRFVIGAQDTVGYSADGWPEAALDLTGDALPDGISYTDHGGGVATLEGTAQPGTAGTYHVTITASNGIDPDDVLEVTIVVVEPVEITTTTLPGGAVGVGYIANIAADGGELPYTFAVTSGSLPAGLSLATNGTISGTPTGPTGTSSFTVEVTDALDPAQTDTQELSITIDRGPTTVVAEPVVLSTTGGLIKLTIGRVSARLTGGNPAVGLAGQVITFKAGTTTVCTTVTGPTGNATCTLSVLQTVQVILNGGIRAWYAGSPLWLPSNGGAGIL